MLSYVELFGCHASNTLKTDWNPYTLRWAKYIEWKWSFEQKTQRVHHHHHNNNGKKNARNKKATFTWIVVCYINKKDVGIWGSVRNFDFFLRRIFQHFCFFFRKCRINDTINSYIAQVLLLENITFDLKSSCVPEWKCGFFSFRFIFYLCIDFFSFAGHMSASHTECIHFHWCELKTE